MSDRLVIFDTTLRDGEQSPGAAMTRDEKVRIWTTALEGAKSSYSANLVGATALMIGNEGNGVSAELAAQADDAITIPYPGPVESLNASVAASVLLYEASRQRAGASHPSRKNIDATRVGHPVAATVKGRAR